MNGIAEVLINQGYEITGSDIARSKITDHLESIGAKIQFRHEAENVASSQVVVASSAIKPDNVEIQAAREHMIPVIHRAEMLAELMRMKHGIAIAGPHGKTTTTSLVATVLAGGNLDPTVVTGGRLNHLGSHAKLGQSKFLVAEADESDGSFIRLSPTISVITTLDEEHLDHYKTFDNMKAVFLSFINRVPFYGVTILCLDDHNLQSFIPKIEKRFITYGLMTQADLTARNIEFNGMQTRFTVYLEGKELGEIETPIPGKHNVCNTLAAVAVGMELDLDFATIRDSLKDFPGVQRRFEIVHNTPDLVLVDDYGHHPAEIQATLTAAKDVWPDRRLIVIFQPHRYSRTQLLFDQFCTSFNNADILVMNSIYAAGEEPIPGIHAKNIAEGVRQFGHKHVHYLETKSEILEHLKQSLQQGDVVLTLGAGDIWEVGRDLLSDLPKPFNR